jgi:malate dehydrogenase
MTVWGNHSATQYPDITTPRSAGKNAAEVVSDQAWLEGDFIPTVQKRGAAIIEARGASSAASAASAAIDHVHDWLGGTPAGDWVSMAGPSDGSYGVAEGILSGFPVTCAGGEYTIVEGLEIDAFSRERIDKSVAELLEERAAVEQLSLLGSVADLGRGAPAPSSPCFRDEGCRACGASISPGTSRDRAWRSCCRARATAARGRGSSV